MTHTNPAYKDRVAIAPYNFVPLPSKPYLVSKPMDLDRISVEDDEGRPVFTGCFDCELTTETPFYIRGLLTSTEYAKGSESKNNPFFFSLDGNKTPRIPGSTLRGLFRSLIEIVTNSRIAAITRQKAVYRAVDTTRLGIQYRERVQEEVREHWFVPRVMAGYIRKSGNEWYIQPAQSINGTTWCRISHKALGEAGTLDSWPPAEVQQGCKTTTQQAGRNAKTIYIQPGKVEFQNVRGDFLHIKFARAVRASAAPDDGLQVAALAESGRIDSKRSEAIIFAPDYTTSPENGWLPLRFTDPSDPDSEIELDREYRDQVSPQQVALLGRPQGALQDMQPVFYLMEGNKLTFFGHTMMLRLPYRKAPVDLVRDELRAEGKDDIDLTESMFGYVRKDSKGKNKAHAGRLYFSDGLYAGNLEDVFEQEIRPRVLASPKTTTFQHYLEQPSPNDKEQLLNYDDATKIRGRKLYWHKGKITISDVQEHDEAKLKHATQYTRIRAVKPGASFKFKLRFENLRSEELGALAWLLQCASNPAYRLKLGMGKPHGMGAVRMSWSLRLNDPNVRYQSIFTVDGNWASGEVAEPAVQSTIEQSVSEFQMRMASDANKFMAQPHIREFLTMLQWPGPDKDRTRYMEIERRDADGRKINEYRYRPVLPTPGFVINPKYQGDRAPLPPRKEREEMPPRPRYEPPAQKEVNTPPPLPEVRAQASAEAEAIAKKLAKPKTISENDVLVAVVTKVTGKEYECALGEGIKVSGKLPSDEMKGLKEGDQVRVRVKRFAGSGAAILTVKGLPKE